MPPELVAASFGAEWWKDLAEQKKKNQEAIEYYTDIVRNTRMSALEREFFRSGVKEARGRWNEFVGL